MGWKVLSFSNSRGDHSSYKLAFNSETFLLGTFTTSVKPIPN